MDFTKSHGMNIDSWYRTRPMVQTLTHGIDIDSWFTHGLMVQTWTHGIGKHSWYGHRLMVLTTAMVLTKTYCIVWVLLNHTRIRGSSVARMRDFYISN